jgi:hypothetical protein
VTIAIEVMPVNPRGVGQDARMLDLPVHSGADARLADAFAEPGCPLCRVRADRERSYVESILVEFVNDVSFRGGLDRARGFCEPHVHDLVEADRRGSGGLLGPAILFHAVLRIRLREVASAHAEKGRSRSKRIAEAHIQPRCQVCAEVRRADLVTAAGLAQLTADPAWAEAAGSAPFCLEHLLVLMAEGPATTSWSAIEARHLARLRDLHDQLETFAHRSSHDRRHSITESQRESVAAAARVLGGDRPRGEQT